ncbi:response regulator [Paenibacillus sedimenti]|uniref:Response regulator n=1 Tax=Paenibacillus sedimenti TaxID=2770274 RepID=A0A926KRI0_9BACL|nr:response regulator [Paenibacillus sedimenti]MBD0380879.1 response regulator [Paenibacillus sedimenti]
MIHLMIVDDEERARTGIRTLIDWPNHGISIAAEARDGAEAIELLKEYPVDILLTDIRMPEMDGLTLIEHVASDYPHIKCVIMSGYDDFEYAKKALAIGASDYLLKPSRRQEILDTVLKLKDQIEEKQMQVRRFEQLHAGFRESFPLLKEKTLNRLVTTENPPYDRLLANLRIHGFEFPHLFFGVIILQIDNFHLMQRKYGNEDIELFKYGLKNIVEETLSASSPCAAFEHQDDLIVIINAEEWTDTETWIPIIEKVQQNTRTYLQFSVSAGIGSFDKDISHLKTSYREAMKALDMKVFIGAEQIVDYKVTVDDDPIYTSYPLAQEKAILQAVMNGDRAAIKAKLDEFNEALKPEGSSKEHVLKSTLALVFALYRFCIEKNINTDKVFGQNLAELTHIVEHSSMDYIMHAILDIVLSVSGQLNEKKNNNKLFQSILEYIQQHYYKDINRETVAREVFITPGYLSLLFKQELKTNFLDYLHKIRIDRARELLHNRSLKISDIAHDVGYNDEKYFFQVFKKYVGMTPTQYRNNLED